MTQHSNCMGKELTTASSIDDLCLTYRSTYCLKNENIHAIEDLLNCTKKQLLSIPNFGKKSLENVRVEVEACGWLFRGDDEKPIEASIPGCYVYYAAAIGVDKSGNITLIHERIDAPDIETVLGIMAGNMLATPGNPALHKYNIIEASCA